MIIRPAAGEDLNPLVGLGGAGDVLERAVGQFIEWRGMRLEGDGFVWVRSAKDASGKDDVKRLCGRGRQGAW